MKPRSRAFVRETLKLAVVAAVVIAAAAAAYAFINPNFTPVHLAEQSDLIAVLKFEGVAKDGRIKASVAKVVKGEAPEKPLTFDFFAGAKKAQGQAVCKMIADGTREAMLFVGFFEAGDEGDADFGDEEEGRGFLHIGGKWIALGSVEEGLWDMVEESTRMLGTWAGSTDMLLRAMRYVLSDPDADVPVQADAEWGEHVLIGKIAGKVHDARPVELTGDGRLSLFIACEGGDRVFASEGGKFVDVTAKHKLTSKSRVALWTNGALLSWDGTVLRLGGRPVTKPGAVKPGCVSLSVVRSEKAKMTVVVGTPASPLTLSLTADGAGEPVALVRGEFPGKDFGPGGRCLVADFDGDAIPDIVQVFAGGGLFYKGKSGGGFAHPAKTRIALGKGESTAQVGDFDADGLPDVFTSAEDANRMWHNLGGGHFVEMLSQSGEIAYISKPGGVGGMTGDINNDGRQDILIAYRAIAPQLFFNRGFRSFGYARQLDLASLKRQLSQASDGQQGACLGDFNGDGAQDMVLVLSNGEVWFFPQQVPDGRALSVSVALPVGEGLPEPVTVTGWLGKRCLGARSVSAGGPPAFFGLPEAGSLTLKWRFPGGQLQTKQVLVVDKPVRFAPRPKK